MSDRDNVLRQAMALPAEDRAYVVTVLEHSLSRTGEGLNRAKELPTDSVSGDALVAELKRRSADYHAGSAKARPAADVLADLNARQASEQSA